MNQGRLNEYVSGRLSDVHREQLERVVARCALCREELDSLQQTRALLRTLPREPLARNFVFTETPAANAAGVYRPAQVRGVRIPGWAYAGAAAVAGVVVIALVLSSPLGVWLPLDSEAELAEIASAPMAMAQAESTPVIEFDTDPMPGAQQGAAAVQPMPAATMPQGTPSATSETGTFGDSMEGPQPASGVVVEAGDETIIEAESLPAPMTEAVGGFEGRQDGESISLPEAGDPGVEEESEAASATVSEVSSAQQAAEVEGTLLAPAPATTQAKPEPPESKAPASAAEEVRISEATAGQRAGEATTRATETPIRAVPAASDARADPPSIDEENTLTPAPEVQGAALDPPPMEATVSSGPASDAGLQSEQALTAEAPPQNNRASATVQVAGSSPEHSVAAVPAPGPILQPNEPATEIEAIAGAGVESGPAVSPELNDEPDRAVPEAVAGAEPRRAAISPAAPGPSDPDVPAAPRSPVGDLGEFSPPEPSGPEGVGVAQVPQGSAVDSNPSGPAADADDDSAGVLRDGQTATVWLAVVAATATAVLVVALFIAIRLRGKHRTVGWAGTNSPPGSSNLVNPTKLEN